MSVITYAMALIITISLLVAIHEYGHYIVARWCGIKVLRFSIGFGKPIWSRRAGPDQTEYCVSALPLGGYVKMLDDREGNVRDADYHRTFNAQPVWQRIAVLLAGPGFNFLFAIAAYWFIFSVGLPVTRPVVGEVMPETPAAQAGLQFNDVIADIGGKQIESWQLGIQVLVDELVDDAQVPLTIERADGSLHSMTLYASAETARLAEPGKLFEQLGFRPWSPRPIVGRVVDGSPAQAAGLQRGDRIVGVGDQPVAGWVQVVEKIRAGDGSPIALTLEREGEALQKMITPRIVGEGDQRVAQIGIETLDQTFPENLYGERKYGVIEALPFAVQQTLEKIGFTFEMFGRMLTGSVSTKNISGPISIAEYAGDSLQRGAISFLDLLISF
ncbi:MAG: RIP metalloprotease RseP [Pseudomonadota bacterium]